MTLSLGPSFPKHTEKQRMATDQNPESMESEKKAELCVLYECVKVN